MMRLLLPTPVNGVSGVPVCIGALFALYLCLVVVVVVAARPRETFRFGDGIPAVDKPTVDMPTVDTPTVDTPTVGKPAVPDSNVRAPSTSSTPKQTAARPRMVRSLQATVADGKDAQLELDDAAFAPSANWMRQDAQYLMRDVLPVHKRLMQTKTLFDGQSDTAVGKTDRCPKVSSTDALMGNQSRAMYQCAETALLRVLPAMNQPVTMGTSPPASEDG
jgi:hypothetical protein